MRAAVLIALAACGGTGSGVDGTRPLIALTVDEQTQLCQYLADAHPARVVVCTMNDQRTGGGPELSTCVSGLERLASANPTCMATEAQAEACLSAIAAYSDGEVCMPPPLPTICAPLHTPECSH